MKIKTFGIFIAVIFTAFALMAKTKVPVRQINSARTGTGKVIVCSPFGKLPGTLSFEEAAKKVRPGMILKLYPGHYNPYDLIVLEQDRLIIEGDGKSGGFVDLPIVMYGEDCVVRNIRCSSIEASDVTITDAMVHSIRIISGGRRGNTVINNVASNSLVIYPNSQDIYIKNTTIVRGVQVKGAGKVVQTSTYTTHRKNIYSIIHFEDLIRKGNVTFDKCVLYTNGHLFYLRKPTAGKLINLNLRDNLIWCKRSLKAVSSDPEKKEPEIKNINQLKEFFDLERIEKPNTLAKLYVKGTLNPNWGWDIDGDDFILTPKSPKYDKGYGCNMGPKNIPVPREAGK